MNVKESRKCICLFVVLFVLHTQNIYTFIFFKESINIYLIFNYTCTRMNPGNIWVRVNVDSRDGEDNVSSTSGKRCERWEHMQSETSSPAQLFSFKHLTQPVRFKQSQLHQPSTSKRWAAATPSGTAAKCHDNKSTIYWSLIKTLFTLIHEMKMYFCIPARMFIVWIWHML